MAAVLYSSSGATSKPYITLNGVTHNTVGTPGIVPDSVDLSLKTY